jgi:hypothetical protein
MSLPATCNPNRDVGGATTVDSINCKLQACSYIQEVSSYSKRRQHCFQLCNKATERVLQQPRLTATAITAAPAHHITTAEAAVQCAFCTQCTHSCCSQHPLLSQLLWCHEDPLRISCCTTNQYGMTASWYRQTLHNDGWPCTCHDIMHDHHIQIQSPRDHHIRDGS